MHSLIESKSCESQRMGKSSRRWQKNGRPDLVCWNMRSVVGDDGIARAWWDHRTEKGAAEKKSVLHISPETYQTHLFYLLVSSLFASTDGLGDEAL